MSPRDNHAGWRCASLVAAAGGVGKRTEERRPRVIEGGTYEYTTAKVIATNSNNAIITPNTPYSSR